MGIVSLHSHVRHNLRPKVLAVEKSYIRYQKQPKNFGSEKSHKRKDLRLELLKLAATTKCHSLCKFMMKITQILFGKNK